MYFAVVKGELYITIFLMPRSYPRAKLLLFRGHGTFNLYNLTGLAGGHFVLVLNFISFSCSNLYVYFLFDSDKQCLLWLSVKQSITLLF